MNEQLDREQRQSNVIYDERIPKLKSYRKRRRNFFLIALIVFFFVIVLLVLYLQSPYSKLEEVELEGQLLLDEQTIMNQAQLQLDMFFFNFRLSSVKERLESLVEVKEVELDRHFPNRLRIQITEYPVVALWAEDQALYPILSTGQILMHHPWGNKRVLYPILTDWQTKEGIIELSQELERLPPALSDLISEIRLTPIFSDPYRLTLYMQDGFEVRTSIRKFAENLSWYPHYVEQVKADGMPVGIIYLLDAKWYVDPTQLPVTVEGSERDEEEQDTETEGDQ
jgi:cell division protein FtsQ